VFVRAVNVRLLYTRVSGPSQRRWRASGIDYRGLPDSEDREILSPGPPALARCGWWLLFFA
jgi:hypothetical protein